MPVTISATASRSGDIKVLGSGTYTTTSFAVYEDAGSFTTSGDIGLGVIEIDITFERGTSTTPNTALGNAAGNSAVAGTDDTATNVCRTHKLWLRRSPVAGNFSGVQLDSATMSNFTNNGFDFSAAQTVYIKIKGTVAQGALCRWVAYLIGSGVK